MNRNSPRRLIAACAALFPLFLAAPAGAQLQSFPKQELIDYTTQNPFGRLPDGRPKVPDELLERARDLSSEDIWATLQQKGYNNQYADGFLVAHPGKNLVGRAFTVQFMPLRADVDDVVQAKAKARGIERLANQTAIDMLQPGDVLVVDLFGKKANGTIVGDNLFYYVMVATHGGGLVVDGSVRDLEGVYFIPPQFAKEVLDRADEIHIHDEWTKKKFAEGKYRSSEIYSSPKDPALQREYEEYLKKRLEEIRTERAEKERRQP